MDTSSIERAPVAPRYPTWVLGSAAVVLSLVLCCVVAEIVLHILPVASGLRSLPVDAGNPIFHFEPNRSFVFSYGWNVPDAEGELQLRLIPHRRGLLWTLAQKSAIARYLLINLKLSRYILDMPALHSIFIGAPAHAQTQFPANGHDARRLEDSLAVIDA